MKFRNLGLFVLQKTNINKYAFNEILFGMLDRDCYVMFSKHALFGIIQKRPAKLVRYIHQVSWSKMEKS